MEISGIFFGSLKTFILSVKLENIRIGTSLNRSRKQRANRYFRARNVLPRNNADVTHSENFVVLFSKKKLPTELRTGQQIYV